VNMQTSALLCLIACAAPVQCLQTPYAAHVSILRVSRAQPRLCALAETDRPASDAESDQRSPDQRRSIRRAAALPCGDALDRRIGTLAIPAILNFLILPITNSVDLFFIGKLGESLAIAGQAAANQVFSTAAWATSVIPTVTVPRVAKARAAGDNAEVQAAVGEAIFVAVLVSSVVTVAIALRPNGVLLAAGSAAGLPFSLPYLRGRLPGLVAEAMATVGFASFRGVMDTATPLRVSLIANALNCALDPILMFQRLGTLPGGLVLRGLGLGVAGAAVATTVSQVYSAAEYLRLLLARGLVRWGTLLRPPSRASLATLAKAGGAVQVRALALNAAFFVITRTTQALDSTGTAAAAHAVTIQLWQLGGVILFALSTVASIVVPAELNKPAAQGGGVAAARAAADRLLAWSFLIGGVLGAAQLAALPLLGAFTPLAEVQRAARVPTIIGAALQLINGLTFVGEGLMVGVGSFGQLAAGQVVATAAIISTLMLTPAGRSLPGVWLTFFLFNGVRFVNAMLHHFWRGPLVPREAAKQ